MSEHIEYAIVPFLIEKGFDRTTAEQISEEFGIEIPDDLPIIRKESIDDLQFLRDDDKEKLWNLVRVAFTALPEDEKEDWRIRHWQRFHFMRTETSMSNLLLQLHKYA